MKFILYIAFFISILTYNLWVYYPKGTFYIGNALFIFFLCLYVYLKDKQSFITFVIFSLSISNLLDELFFDIFLSMIIGVGGAYISSDYVQHNISREYISIVIAVIAITAEKIGEFLIYKLNVDLFLTAFVDSMISVLTKKKG